MNQRRPPWQGPPPRVTPSWEQHLLTLGVVVFIVGCLWWFVTEYAR